MEHEKAVVNQFQENRFVNNHNSHKKIAKALEDSIVSELICDPDSLYPVVAELEDDVRFSCSQVIFQIVAKNQTMGPLDRPQTQFGTVPDGQLKIYL